VELDLLEWIPGHRGPFLWRIEGHENELAQANAASLAIMKTKIYPIKTGILLLVSILFCLPATSQTETPAEEVTVVDGVSQVEKDGEWIPLEKELALASTIKVQTNGTFTVDGGKARTLKEGQILRKDGYLLNPDGTMAPVYDRITAESIGVTTLFRDGTGSLLTTPYKLPNGIQVSPDGTMILANGKMKRLVPGQMLKLNGEVLSAKDTVTMRDGTVYAQKEGVQYKVEPNRSFTMNDGTKVFGSGKLVGMDGSEQTLSEGEVITLPGVTTK
jgi:hypothetical protein